MIRAERHERILGEVARRGAVSAQDLAALLDASLATIRRDIADLDGRGVLRRIHGGASLPEARQERPFDAKLHTFLAEKRRIATAAAAMVEDGMVVGCGGGTTVMQMVPAIRYKTLTLVTTAVNVALELRQSETVTVVLTGGVLRGRTAETVGHLAERTLRDLNLDVAIVGVDGISERAGLTTYDLSEAFVTRVMTERAAQTWIVADHSKFGRAHPAVIRPLAGTTRIVTDEAVAAADAAMVTAAGVDLVRA